jgi:hypothetical protein
MVSVNDIVLHTLSGLYYRCENKKQSRWMVENKYYVKVDKLNAPPESYFYKNIGKHSQGGGKQ